MSLRPVTALVLGAVTALAACTVGASPSPSGAAPSPSGAAPSSSPASAVKVLLRAATTQALAPTETFDWLPSAQLGSDDRWLTPGPTPAVFPGPLVPVIAVRTVDATAWPTVVSAVRAAGLLDGPDLDPGPDVVIDMSGQPPLAGGRTDHLELLIDGTHYDISGDGSAWSACADGAACPTPEPGSPAAFAWVWQRLADPDTLLGSATGPADVFRPDAYALLTGPAPVDSSGLQGPPVAWPLSTPVGMIGSPLTGDPTRRCAVVGGSDAEILAPVLQQATEPTVWTDPAVEGSRFGLSVRPMLPGDEDPCSALTGM